MDYTTLATIYRGVHDEIARRSSLRIAQVKEPSLTTAYLATLGRVDGEEWVQPLGAHDAYPLDWVVIHNGKTWVSLVDANVWEPGVSGWREDGTEETPSEWIQPTGAHDAYALGSIVTHNGSTWTSTVDANTWEPGVYGWVQS